jgi:predicted amidohydrolase
VNERIEIAVAQFAPERLDPEGNLARMADIARAEAQADIVVFPELATTGYVPEPPSPAFHDALRRASEAGCDRLERTLGAVARETGTHVVVGVSEVGEDGQLYNSLVWLDRAGGETHVHRKVHLYQRERAYFAAGDRFDVFDTDVARIGLLVCYDTKFPEAARLQALAGAELLISVFAYTEDPGVPPDILRQRAVIRGWENGVFFVAANRLGREDDDEFVGRSAIAGPTGRTLHDLGDGRAPVVRASLDAADLRLASRDDLLRVDRRDDVYALHAALTRGTDDRA